jgi:succinate dehydrogenase / fumarate reductase cytochrome b subunit
MEEPVAQRRLARRRSEFGSLYRGRAQWSWIAHRVTGVAIILFLFAHVVDTALVGWGPEAYNKVVGVYHHPIIQILEIGLVGAVLYHALNGVRIMIMDFWPGSVVHHNKLVVATVSIFLASMAPITFLMGRRVLERLF